MPSGCDRASYYRLKSSLGGLGNSNIEHAERSAGHWVHILQIPEMLGVLDYSSLQYGLG